MKWSYWKIYRTYFADVYLHKSKIDEGNGKSKIAINTESYMSYTYLCTFVFDTEIFFYD